MLWKGSSKCNKKCGSWSLRRRLKWKRIISHQHSVKLWVVECPAFLENRFGVGRDDKTAFVRFKRKGARRVDVWNSARICREDDTKNCEAEGVFDGQDPTPHDAVNFTNWVEEMCECLGHVENLHDWVGVWCVLKELVTKSRRSGPCGSGAARHQHFTFFFFLPRLTSLSCCLSWISIVVWYANREFSKYLMKCRQSVRDQICMTMERQLFRLTPDPSLFLVLLLTTLPEVYFSYSCTFPITYFSYFQILVKVFILISNIEKLDNETRRNDVSVMINRC